MRMLSAEGYDAAVRFLEAHGRPIDLALYRHAFGGGTADAVLEALAAFQNPDGGCGHSLEPDALVAESSVLDTTHALQIMTRLQIPSDHPQLVWAMGYLREAYEEDFAGWPIRPFASAQTVCAPWWKSADIEAWREKTTVGWLNPTVEVLGYFLDHGRPDDREWIDRVAVSVAHGIVAAEGLLEAHELLCLSRLTRSVNLDEELRGVWIERVRRDVAEVVNPDPASWDGYGLKPWWIAETPDDPLLGELEPGLVEAMLDHEIDRQEADGGWPPFWDWSGLHPEAWADARRDWTGVLTEQMLRVLRYHGRLPDPVI